MSNPLRALIVEDSPDDTELMLIHLRRAEYDVTYRNVQTPDQMQEALETERWDVILCDHALPRFSSDQALKLVKKMMLDIPFIIVSGMIGEEHAVAAMRAGCHDYVMKDQLARLAPAIRREMREAGIRRDRRQAKQALRESQGRVQQVIESLPIALFSHEANTNRVLLVMGAVKELTGYDVSDFLSPQGLHDKLVHPDDANYIYETYREGLASMKPFSLEHRIVHGQDGRIVWLYNRVVPVADQDGSLLRHDSVVLDITQRKQAEAEREQMQAQLLRAQKLESIGVLAGGIAHDFNNLLTIIAGNAQVLSKSDSLSPDQRALLHDIETASIHAAEMTRSLQAFTRPARPHIRPTDTNRLVEGIYRLLRRTIPATIDFWLDLETQPCFMAADPGQIQQVLVNLCINARDAMPTGGTLRIQTRQVHPDTIPSTAKRDPAADHYVRISVTDNGCGMSPDMLARVFDPFFTTKPMDRGTGLGLSVVYRIVQAHDGVMDVTSKLKEGTRFDIFLPAVKPASADQQSEALPLASGHERILVVEDEEMIGSLLKTILESRGYGVALARDPEEAIELASSCGRPPFHLAIVDYALPRMHGDLCVKALRQANPRLRAILITGYRLDASELAVNDCQIIQKPFTVPGIAQMVRETLDKEEKRVV